MESDASIAAAHASTMSLLKANTNLKIDGELFLWNGFDHARPLPFKVADFGLTQISELRSLHPSRTVKGNPFDGCDEKGFNVNVRGAFVILERGSCSFVDKVMNVQRVGGIMAIIVNTRKKPYLFSLPKGPNGAHGVHIPAIMIGHDSAEEIDRLGTTMIGRLSVDPNGS